MYAPLNEIPQIKKNKSIVKCIYIFIGVFNIYLDKKEICLLWYNTLNITFISVKRYWWFICLTLYLYIGHINIINKVTQL